MDFSKFSIQGEPKVVKSKPIEKTKPKKGQPSADYSEYQKVFQTCEKCRTEKLHIISKLKDRVRCTECGFTYLLEKK